MEELQIGVASPICPRKRYTAHAPDWWNFAEKRQRDPLVFPSETFLVPDGQEDPQPQPAVPGPNLSGDGDHLQQPGTDASQYLLSHNMGKSAFWIKV